MLHQLRTVLTLDDALDLSELAEVGASERAAAHRNADQVQDEKRKRRGAGR